MCRKIESAVEGQVGVAHAGFAPTSVLFDVVGKLALCFVFWHRNGTKLLFLLGADSLAVRGCRPNMEKPTQIFPSRWRSTFFSQPSGAVDWGRRRPEPFELESAELPIRE